MPSAHNIHAEVLLVTLSQILFVSALVAPLQITIGSILCGNREPTRKRMMLRSLVMPYLLSLRILSFLPYAIPCHICF
jgi:hypothetical protein